jgi:hypothetical protein
MAFNGTSVGVVGNNFHFIANLHDSATVWFLIFVLVLLLVALISIVTIIFIVALKVFRQICLCGCFFDNADDKKFFDQSSRSTDRML